jgi:hypothetical protein
MARGGTGMRGNNKGRSMQQYTMRIGKRLGLTDIKQSSPPAMQTSPLFSKGKRRLEAIRSSMSRLSGVRPLKRSNSWTGLASSFFPLRPFGPRILSGERSERSAGSTARLTSPSRPRPTLRPTPHPIPRSIARCVPTRGRAECVLAFGPRQLCIVVGRVAPVNRRDGIARGISELASWRGSCCLPVRVPDRQVVAGERQCQS